jgi:signal transduction histidine kinase
VPDGNGTDEIGHLARKFNRMLERLERSFGMQKSFIAHASHELRTPLTSINGQIEVLMMKDRTGPEYKQALVSVLEDIRSLIDLMNKLLVMARTSAEGPLSFNDQIRIDEILWLVREELKKINDAYDINISLNDNLNDTGQMTVRGDEYLLKTAMSNLADNACKYSPDHKVDISINHTGKYLEIKFSNKGNGIPEEELTRVFEPFFRGTMPCRFRNRYRAISGQTDHR